MEEFSEEEMIYVNMIAELMNDDPNRVMDISNEASRLSMELGLAESRLEFLTSVTRYFGGDVHETVP